MLENLKRLREPAAWVVIAAIAGFMALSVVRLVVAMTTAKRPVFAAFQDIANSSMSLTLVALLVALVCACLFLTPSTPRAPLVAKVALIVVSLGTLLTCVATLLGIYASNGIVLILLEVIGGLLDIVLKVLAVVVLAVIARAAGAGRLTAAPEPVIEAAPEPQPVVDESPAVWRPSEASGSVWRTAAEAAAGSAPAYDTAQGVLGPAATGTASAWAVPHRSAEVEHGPDGDVPAVTSAVDGAVRTAPGGSEPGGAPHARAGAAEAIGWRPVRRADTTATGREGDTP